MYHSIELNRKIYITPVVSFEMIEDDDRALLGDASGTGGDTVEKPSDGDVWAKESDFVFESDFEYQIEGMN